MSPYAYASVNAFFTRALTDSARPVASGKAKIVIPADGAVSQIGDIIDGRIFQAKGHNLSLLDLTGGDNDRAKQFEEGKFITIYLSPRDYHRFHMPIAGELREMVYIPGRLFSVNQITARNIPNLFARNERVVAVFDTAAGPMAMVFVGAMIVAGIETSWAGVVTPPTRALEVTTYKTGEDESITLKKGDEVGRFNLGSTVIVLFSGRAVEWNSQLKEGTPTRMGESMASINENSN